MILTIIIESAVIMALLYFGIKKIISLKTELDIQKKTKEQALDNIKSYKAIIEKLNKRGKESEEVKKQINTASGADLAALANSL